MLILKNSRWAWTEATFLSFKELKVKLGRDDSSFRLSVPETLNLKSGQLVTEWIYLRKHLGILYNLFSHSLNGHKS